MLINAPCTLWLTRRLWHVHLKESPVWILRRFDGEHPHLADDLRLLRAIALCDRRLRDCLRDVESVDDFAERGIAAVELLRAVVVQTDEELAAGTVGELVTRHGALSLEGIALPCHGDHALAHLVVGELGVNRVAGPAGAVAAGVAALDNETLYHAVKIEPVVKAGGRQPEKVRHRMRRV